MQKTMETKYCHECAQIIKTKAEICPYCGVRQKGIFIIPDPLSGKKNKTIAAILAFFLGYLGAHKFYLGKIKTAVLYLLFCWTFIPALLAFIDFIMLLIISDEQFNETYNT